MKVPTPVLTYYQWRIREAEGELPTADLVGEGPPLYNVHEVHASLRPDGRLSLTVHGSLRKRDGERGAHNRCLTLDLDADQPPWVHYYVRDAVARLKPLWESS